MVWVTVVYHSMQCVETHRHHGSLQRRVKLTGSSPPLSAPDWPQCASTLNMYVQQNGTYPGSLEHIGEAGAKRTVWNNKKGILIIYLLLTCDEQDSVRSRVYASSHSV